MRERSVERCPFRKQFVPDQYKTLEMTRWAVEKEPETLKYFNDRYKTLQVCFIITYDIGWCFWLVQDQGDVRKSCFKDPMWIGIFSSSAWVLKEAQKSYKRAIEHWLFALNFVPDQQ